MNFIEWLDTQQTDRPMLHASANPRTIRTRTDRERLTRMEAMLRELVTLKQNFVDRRKAHASIEI